MADGAARQRKHRQLQRDRGLVQVALIVPADKLDLVKRLAARLRWKHDTTIVRDGD